MRVRSISRVSKKRYRKAKQSIRVGLRKLCGAATALKKKSGKANPAAAVKQTGHKLLHAFSKAKTVLACGFQKMHVRASATLRFQRLRRNTAYSYASAGGHADLGDLFRDYENALGQANAAVDRLVSDASAGIVVARTATEAADATIASARDFLSTTAPGAHRKKAGRVSSFIKRVLGFRR